MANKSSFKFKRMDLLMRNMRKEIKGIKNRTHKGLIEAAIIIQRAAEPGTPVDLGNLRSSWFILSYKSSRNYAVNKEEFKGDDAFLLKARHRQKMQELQQVVAAVGSDNNPVVMFGYTANYAAYVHEKVGAKFKRSGARARWFYLAILTNMDKVLEVIRENARIR